MKTSALVKTLILASLAAAQIDVSGNGDGDVVKRQETINITPAPPLNLTEEEIVNQGDSGDLRRIDKRQLVDVKLAVGDKDDEEDDDDDDNDDDNPRENPVIGGGRSSKRASAPAGGDDDVVQEGDDVDGDEDRKHPRIGGGRGSRKRTPQDSESVNVGDLVAGSSGNSTDPSQLEGSQTRRINWPKKQKKERRQDTETVNVGDLSGGANSTDPSTIEGSDTRRIHNHHQNPKRQDSYHQVDVGELTGAAGNSTDPSQLEGSQTRRINWPKEKRGEDGEESAQPSAASVKSRIGGSRGGRMPIGRRMRYGKRNDA